MPRRSAIIAKFSNSTRTTRKLKEWINQIIDIYEGLNKDYPKEGEEPPALPFKKES